MFCVIAIDTADQDRLVYRSANFNEAATCDIQVYKDMHGMSDVPPFMTQACKEALHQPGAMTQLDRELFPSQQGRLGDLDFKVVPILPVTKEYIEWCEDSEGRRALPREPQKTYGVIGYRINDPGHLIYKNERFPDPWDAVHVFVSSTYHLLAKRWGWIEERPIGIDEDLSFRNQFHPDGVARIEDMVFEIVPRPDPPERPTVVDYTRELVLNTNNATAADKG